MADFETLTLPCSFCGVSGCDLCIFDGDAMHNAPTCCAEAAAMDVAWWDLSTVDRERFPRGASSDDMSADDARAVLRNMVDAARRSATLRA